MKYQTALMNEILTSPKAQEMIDYVSQIYGDSYVGLWLFQAMGSVLGPIYEESAQLRYETSPATATLLLDMWEQSYGFDPDPELNTAQRRARHVAAKPGQGASTPKRLANLVSAILGGVTVEVLERTGKNHFTVNVRASVKSVAAANALIYRLKPAHLTYTLQGTVLATASTNVKIGVVTTQALTYKVEVK